jgi:Arc/MetJ family transcription regulator
MASHMKTTIVISDALLAEADKIIAEEKTTLKALVNEGLATVVRERRKLKSTYRLPDRSYGEGGLRDEVTHLTMSEIIAMANDRD